MTQVSSQQAKNSKSKIMDSSVPPIFGTNVWNPERYES